VARLGDLLTRGHGEVVADDKDHLLRTEAVVATSVVLFIVAERKTKNKKKQETGS